MKAIEQAAFNLSVLYRHAAHNLVEALANKGIKLNHRCPRVTAGQPHVVEGPLALLDMRHKVQETGQLWVSSDFSDQTIYPEPSDNHWFRFVHDMGHLLYDCGFDSEGEAKLHPLLWQWLATVPGFHSLTPQEQRWCWAVYMADTQGQSDYFDEHGEFPEDQRAFVITKAKEYYDAQA